MMKYTPMLLNLNYKFWLLITSKKNQEEAKEILILQLSNQYLKHTCISFAISRDIIAKRFPRSRPASFFIFRFTKVERHENPPPRLYPRGTSPSKYSRWIRRSDILCPLTILHDNFTPLLDSVLVEAKYTKYLIIGEMVSFSLLLIYELYTSTNALFLFVLVN